MSGELTIETLRQAFEQMGAVVAHPPAVVMHPLDRPFMRVFYGEIPVRVEDIWTVARWRRECQRKYVMGHKTGDPRWTLDALIKQYTTKVEALRV